MSARPGFAAVRRSHRIVELLAGRFFDGMSNSEVAEAVGASRPNTARDLAVLEDIGLAHKLDNGRWALTTRALAVYRAFALNHERLQARMGEGLRNIEAGARSLGVKEENRA